MQDLNIDLGKSPEESGCAVPAPPKDSKKYFPSLYLDGLDDLDLPKEGQLLITYCLKSETHRETTESESHSFELEVRSIDGVEGSSKEKSTASDDFESRMKAHLDEAEAE